MKMFVSTISKVWLLMVCHSFSFCAVTLMLFIGGLIGMKLAPTPVLSTLPIACMVIGMALGVYPAIYTMRRMGRSVCIVLCNLLGVVSCGVACIALMANSFLLFSAAGLLLGLTNACLQQLRFTAFECVPRQQGASAVSMVMCGGLLASIVGPEIAVFGQYLFEIEFLGAFVLVGICFLVPGVLSVFWPLRDPDVDLMAFQQRQKTAFGTPDIRPAIFVAIACSAIAFVVMSFVSVATPINMHHHGGHSLESTKFVMQSHMAAMYLPSLLIPIISQWVTIKKLMLTGLLCYMATVVLGFQYTGVTGFWMQLVLLGIGWNLLFLAGTLLLSYVSRPDNHYRLRMINDSTVFSVQAVAVLSAGWLVNVAGWETVLLFCLVPIGLLLMLLLLNSYVFVFADDDPVLDT